MLKKKVAFICVHNSCRSQIAEAIGKIIAGDKYDFYSAGTQKQPKINQDAVRLIKAIYGVDMESTQFSKTIDEIPSPDIAISMGCNVTCPFIGRNFDENWGLEDPTGKSDEFFLETIKKIEEKIKEL
ncbi:MAG: arsenate reductase ArsC [Fibrobacteraceae bacterium]|nr:arsenate reductase ArsC [Fibrobacteraceae bacterium]